MRLFDKINVDSILNEGLNESNMFTQFDARFLSPDEEVVVPNSTMFPSAISKNGGQVLNKAIIAGVFIAGIGAGERFLKTIICIETHGYIYRKTDHLS